MEQEQNQQTKQQNEVLEFIHRRFPIDCAWTTGNCRFFAEILKLRFPNGSIYYDPIPGHFLFKYQDTFYDWTGKVKEVYRPIEWKGFKDYDELEYKRIIRDCVM